LTDSLVVQADDKGWNNWSTAGSGLFDSTTELLKDRDSIPLDATMVTLDVLALLLNPLGELMKAGVGWLMEQLSFLREPLDYLAGNPDKIEALSQTWLNIAKELRDSANLYDQEILKVRWSGDAGIAYKKAAQEFTAAMRATATHSKVTAQCMAGIGILIATARAMIYDAIATFVSKIIAEAILAAAVSPFTFGSAWAIFSARLTAELALIKANIYQQIVKLVKRLAPIVRKLNLSGQRSVELANKIYRRSCELGLKSKNAIKNAEEEILRQGTNANYKTYVDRAHAIPYTNFVEIQAVTATKEAVKSGNAFHEEAVGDAPNT
jgi:hypothetical protein